MRVPKLSYRNVVLFSAIAAALVIGISVIASVTQNKPRPASVSSVASPARPHGERGDLLFIRIDDRTSSGITDFWLKWKIKNTSHQKSDYSFDWEAVDTRSGVRVDSGSELETNVLPGQTTTGDTFTMLESAQHIKINITKFDRTKSDSL
jgi:hypothetical protein